MATHLKISDAWCIMWIITKFSGSTPVLHPSAVNPGENSYKPRVLWKHSSLASFLSLTVIQSRMASSEGHDKHTSSVPSVKPTLSWIEHSRSFKVILIGASRNSERCVVMFNWCRHYFWNLRIKRENGKFVDFNDLTQVWRRPSKKPLRISANN